MIDKEYAGLLLKDILTEDYSELFDKIIEGQFVFMHFDVDKQKFVRLTFKDIVMAYYELEDKIFLYNGFVKCAECGYAIEMGYQCKNPITGKCDLINNK